MSVPRYLLPALGASAVVLLTVYSLPDSTAMLSAQSKVPNPITGEGLPNPAPKVTKNWGELPAGRTWGTSAGLDVDPKDGHIWGYERCGAGTAGGGPVDCENNPVDPVFKFDRHTGKVLANIGKGTMVTPHGIHVDKDGNVWVADFAGNKEGDQGPPGPQVQPEGREAHEHRRRRKTGQCRWPVQSTQRRRRRARRQHLRVGRPRCAGHDDGAAIAEGLKRGATSRISKFTADGKFVKSWGGIGMRHGEFRTPHALMFDAKGRLWVADRGNHRLEIFDQDGKYLESRYAYGRISGFFIARNQIYAIDSESGPLNHPNWRNGVRIGPLDEDRIVAFIPPFEREDRLYQGTAGEGIAVDSDGNVYAAEGPNSIRQAGGAFTKYSVK